MPKKNYTKKKRCQALTNKKKACRSYQTKKNNPEHHVLCCHHLLIVNKNQHLVDANVKINNYSSSLDNQDLVKNVNDEECEYGICCFCQNYCNPCSQACGRCMRNNFY